jgi:hypothetical protein
MTTGSDLVGRGEVLARLRRAVEEAAAGRGQVVLLTGDAGIGKTAVASAVADHARRAGAQVAWGSAWQGEGAPGYWPWVQVLRSLDPGGRTWPPPAPAAEQAPAAARFQLFDELTSTLLARARQRPLLLVLDDLQWADPASLLLLDFLARRIRVAPLLVVGTYREPELAPEDPVARQVAEVAAGATVLPLAALSEAEVGGLMAAILGQEPEPALAADVRRRTGGNPFFVQQVTRLLLAQAAADGRVGAADAAGIPLGVREAVGRRLARLSEGCAEVLTAAAVVGQEFSPALLASVTGRPGSAVTDLLEEAARARVLSAPAEPTGSWRFAHDLFREAVHQRLGAADAARLHLAVGRALQQQRAAGGGVSPALLAHHFVRAAAAGGAGEAVAWSATAAEEATGRLAHEEAARHRQRALEVLEASGRADDPRRAERLLELLLELGAARRRTGDLAGSRQAYQRAAALARRGGDARRLALAALGLQAIGTRSWPSLLDELVPLLEEAAAALGEQPTPLRALVLAGLARELAWTGLDVERAAGLAEAAVAAARRAGDRATLAACLLAEHNVVWGPGNAAARLRLAGEVAELARAGGELELEAEARLLRAADLLERADPAVHAELAGFLRLAGTLRQPRLRYAALTRRALLAQLGGRLQEAERLVGEAAALARELGEPDAADVELSQLWELRGLQGRRAELPDRLLAALPDDSTEARGLLAMVLLEQGDRDGAELAARPLLDAGSLGPARGRGWLVNASFGAELSAALRHRPACEGLLAALTPYAGEAAVAGAAIAFRGAVEHWLGVLAAALDRTAEARAHLERAVAVHERLGAVPWALRSRYELAGVRLAAGEEREREQALAALAEVAEQAGRLGLAELAGLARERRRRALEVPVASGVFHRDGTLWTLGFAGTTVRMKDAKGLRDLAALLARPGQPLHAAELVAGSGAPAAGLRLGADEVLDERARRELRARLADLEEEVDEAERWFDPERAARARQERDALVDELAAAAGLGGRPRRLGDQAERARKTVTARIRDAVGRVERLHPALGEHLRASVTTGTFCAYSPSSPVHWELS